MIVVGCPKYVPAGQLRLGSHTRVHTRLSEETVNLIHKFFSQGTRTCPATFLCARTARARKRRADQRYDGGVATGGGVGKGGGTAGGRSAW